MSPASHDCQPRLKVMTHIPRSRERISRLGDQIIASGLIALTLPLMVIVAILIKCDSRGAVFVREQRFTARGQPIIATRFRTRETAFRGKTVTYTTVTRIGRFLEYTRMDKLPQLSNVLRGEMTCIDSDSEYPFFLD